MKELTSQRFLSGARYLALSMITGVIELGAILFAARSGWSLPAVLALGLTYQVAALFVCPFPLAAGQYRLLLVGGVAIGAVAVVVPYAIPPALLASAIGLQGVREEQLANARVPTLPKRAARIVGFVISAVFNPWWLLVMPVAVLCAAGGWRSLPRESSRQRRQKPRVSRYAIMMVIHQSHYFVYAYTLLYVLARMFAPSALLAATIFGIGWITYTLAPVFFGRMPARVVLVAGHLLVASVMAVIAGSIGNHVVVTAAWVVSGLGGGSVFCIKKMAAKLPHAVDDLDAWENIGHVTGSAGALALVLVFPMQYVFAAAGLLAASTAFLGIALAAPHFSHGRPPASRGSGQ